MFERLDDQLAMLRSAPMPMGDGIAGQMWDEIRRRDQVRGARYGAIRRHAGVVTMALVIGMILSTLHPAARPKPLSVSLLLTEVPPASLLE